MNVVVAIDSFKGSLSSLTAGQAIKEGILAADSKNTVTVCPIADGGEGTVDALVIGMEGAFHTVTVTGPLGDPVDCKYGIKDHTAIIEMSGAAGITLIPKEALNPLKTTTYGVGEVIRDAIDKGCRHFIIGLGGSATNDGGAGMLMALGYRLLDQDGMPIPLGAGGLKKLVTIETDTVIPALSECTFRIASDVKNPLCGENGASAVFGPQKGADPEMVKELDRLLYQFSEIAKTQFPNADRNTPGAGAAGGLGFAFVGFIGAKLESGIHIVLEETRLREKIQNADVVVTGEGRLDGQTAMGKAPIGVAELAKSEGKTVIAFAGSVTDDAGSLNQKGIDAFFPILRSVVTLSEAMEEGLAYKNMRATAEQVFRILKITERI